MRSNAVRFAALAAGALVVCGRGVFAHHSTAAEFDQSKPITFVGTVDKVIWMNPHIYTHVTVKTPGAPDIVYRVEGGAPNTLFRNGWRKESLPKGETVTVTGWRAKNPDSPNVGQATIVNAQGRRMYSGNGPARVAE